MFKKPNRIKKPSFDNFLYAKFIPLIKNVNKTQDPKFSNFNKLGIKKFEIEKNKNKNNTKADQIIPYYEDLYSRFSDSTYSAFTNAPYSLENRVESTFKFNSEKVKNTISKSNKNDIAYKITNESISELNSSLKKNRKILKSYKTMRNNDNIIFGNSINEEDKNKSNRLRRKNNSIIIMNNLNLLNSNSQQNKNRIFSEINSDLNINFNKTISKFNITNKLREISRKKTLKNISDNQNNSLILNKSNLNFEKKDSLPIKNYDSLRNSSINFNNLERKKSQSNESNNSYDSIVINDDKNNRTDKNEKNIDNRNTINIGITKNEKIEEKIMKRSLKRKVNSLLNECKTFCTKLKNRSNQFNDKIVNHLTSEKYKNSLIEYHKTFHFRNRSLNPARYATNLESIEKNYLKPEEIFLKKITPLELKMIQCDVKYFVNDKNLIKETNALRVTSLKDILKIEEESENRKIKKHYIKKSNIKEEIRKKKEQESKRKSEGKFIYI